MTWQYAHFEAVFVTLMALVAVVVILQQRRTPQSTAAWLLFIIVVPYVSIPLFLALGFRKHASQFTPVSFADMPKPSGQATVFQHYDLPALTDGNDLQLQTSGKSAHETLIALCNSATRDLDVLFYIVANDPVGRNFVTTLTAKAKEGVRVRLLMDGLGNLMPPRTALAAFKKAGGQVLYFSPLIQRPNIGHLNLRNHRKMVIADGQRVFAGGMNVGTKYMGPQMNADYWTDLAYRLEGPAVAAFRDVFASDWVTAGGRPSPLGEMPGSQIEGTTTAQLIPSGPDVRGDPLHEGLISAIHQATQRVWIVTPYFLPTEFLGSALSIAAKRGVDVRILVPQKSNQRLADFARGAYLREMQDAGCKIYFFQNGMIHAKAGIIDNTAFVGSANFDVRSMLLNFEVVLFVSDTGSVEDIANWYLSQERLSETGIHPAGLFRRISEGIFRLGAPIL